jgi:hypothetical protein
MTANDIKNEFQTMQVIAKKLLSLSDEQRSRVINFLLQSVSGESSAQDEIKTIGFCLAKIEKLGKDEGNAVVKFLVDRFLAPRPEKTQSSVEQDEEKEDEEQSEKELWEELETK